MSKTRRWLFTYLIAAGTFAVIDVVWIALVATPQYRDGLGHLIADRFNIPAAAVFYLGYVAGLVHFGIRPLDPSLGLGSRVRSAALYGLFTYGTWALTGLTLLKGFPTIIAITDIAWGVAVCSVVTLVTTQVLGRVGRPPASGARTTS